MNSGKYVPNPREKTITFFEGKPQHVQTPPNGIWCNLQNASNTTGFCLFLRRFSAQRVKFGPIDASKIPKSFDSLPVEHKKIVIFHRAKQDEHLWETLR